MSIHKEKSKLNIETLINTIYVSLVFLAFLIIGLLFSRDLSFGTIDETDTWYYFFASIMETFGPIIGILVAIAIYSSKSDKENKLILHKSSWLITLNIFIIIICIVSLYYTELIWQLRTDGVKFFDLNYKSYLTSATIYLCIFYLLSIVLFLHELLCKDVVKKDLLHSKEVLVLSFAFIGFIFGIGINVIKYILV
jgi:hypothetical protein